MGLQINSWIHDLSDSVGIQLSKVVDLNAIVTKVSNLVLEWLTFLVKQLPQFMMNYIIFIFSLYFFLVHRRRVFNQLLRMELLPFDQLTSLKNIFIKVCFTVLVSPTRKLETAVFAGGCFWGVEGVFSHVKGVRLAQSGYAGGPRGKAVDYDRISRGDTGFAESVSVTYDPQQVSYGQLLRVFFSVIADPTTLNYQGPDHGSQYRSALFPLNESQAKAARAYLAQLDKAKLWSDPVVTKVEPFNGFVKAEGYHQDFMANNPRHPYIVRWDAAKVDALKRLYPDLYNPRAAR